MASDDFAFVMVAEPEDAENSPHIISTAGGWLYDIAGSGLDDQEATIYFHPYDVGLIQYPLPLDCRRR